MATTTDTTVPKRQTTSPTTPRFSAFFIEVVCTLGTTPSQTVISPPPNGGNGVIRITTRRRHADSQPLMLQTPTATGVEGTRGTAGPGCGARGPRNPWAAGPDNEPTRRSKLAARTAEVGGADTTASRISHVIPPQHESTQAQTPQNINDQNPNSDMRSREVYAKLLVDSHSWASGRCAEPHVSTLSSPAAHPAPPAPKQPAGPQATASATQQHVVSYNPSVIMGA